MQNIKFYIKAPSIFWLYFLLLISFISFGVFLIYQFSIQPNMNNIVTWISVFVAFIGVILAGLLNLKNSIKQHTISYWLDVRTSDAYNESLKIVNKFGEEHPISNQQIVDSENFKKDIEPHLSHILNHLEFCSVCLRTGDFDEFILKNAMAGIVKKNFEFAEFYIKSLRKKENRDSIFEHLEAVYVRWIKC